eukprot:CAMPEP_0202345718 /NCGR_PEP_ID=MMETSP1126-20121109/4831_1 /ASSEMBLY_ACC=CAM_ASM_000457 /TAXON_ID=3047 /ORGANISM="Dunaliella tertiolecta, Strain CCMP1320" /LENGTH=176 /DNA_ID=CAMNT_0048937051 /DNA_START=1351 /DNA_END=1881 /DNA_ORIENTATION=+
MAGLMISLQDIHGSQGAGDIKTPSLSPPEDSSLPPWDQFNSISTFEVTPPVVDPGLLQCRWECFIPAGCLPTELPRLPRSKPPKQIHLLLQLPSSAASPYHSCLHPVRSGDAPDAAGPFQIVTSAGRPLKSHTRTGTVRTPKTLPPSAPISTLSATDSLSRSSSAVPTALLLSQHY